nr:hypothetical protein [Bacilli bacterium]
NHSEFAPSNIEGMLHYGGKDPIRKLDLFKENKIYASRFAAKYLIDKYRVNDPCQVLLYNSNPNPYLLDEVIENYDKDVALNIGVPSLDTFMDEVRYVEKNRLKNINFFAADPLAMSSYISKPQDLVIACPDSSSFDEISSHPDFFIHLRNEKLDLLFKKEKEVLEGASKFVEEKGTLIYCVFTISKKETHQTVFDFCNNHKEFHLQKEVQLYPYDETGLGVTMYYAVLIKDTALAKDQAPIGELPLTPNEKETAISAQENK